MSGSENLKLSKNLTGRDWRDDDTFTFHMTQLATDPVQLGDSAIPADVVFDYGDQSNNAATGSFGDIQFTQPGTYTFYIGEVTTGEAASLPGVTYSQASYQVTVVLTDNGNGTMASSVTMMQVRDDGGTTVSEAVDNKVAAFTNTYNVDGTSASFTLDKNYTDNSGAKRVEDGDFSVRLTAVGGYATDEGAPTDGSSYSIPSDDVPMPKQTEFFNTGLRFTVAGIPFDGNDVGNTYVYRVAEVQRGEANMTYDKNSYEVSISVAEVEDSTGATAVVPTVTLPDGGITFNNTFNPGAAGLDNLGGNKMLKGRDMLPDETFGFTLTPTGDTVQAVTDGIVTMADPTATVSGLKNGEGQNFTFGRLTFSRAGTYTFTITETQHNGAALPEDGTNGMTYDRHTCNVTVTVGLNDQNNLAVTGINYGAAEVNNNFVNTYTASYSYGTSTSGGLDVSKKLNGRNMLQGEFGFTIAGANSQLEGAVSANEADDKLTGSDKSFSNGAADNGVANVMNKLRSLTFNQADAGKTFVYMVSETRGNLPQVTYDANTYTVAIVVSDDGDSTMHTNTTVYNKDGGVVSEGVWDDHATEGNTVATVSFVNTYDPNEASLTDDAGTALSVNKRVTGAPTDADFNFTLLLTGQPEGSTVGGLTEEPDEEGTTYNVAHAQVTENFTADDVANGTVHGASFGDLTFDKPGTYTFLVVEDEAQGEGASNNWPAGWTYNDSVRHIQVVVTDVNPDYDPVNPSDEEPMYDGNLYIDSVSRNPVTFTNSYDHGNVTLQGDTALQVKKAVTGHTTDADFSFTLKPVEAEGVNWETVEYDGAALNAAINDGFTTEADLGTDNAKAASFGAITFTEPGTYQFTVTEDQAHDGEDDPAGWTYDKATPTITVTVSEKNADDQYDGQLHATVTTDMAPNTDPVLFTNTYTGNGELDGAANLVVTKNLVGRGWTADDEFTFSIAAGDEATQQAIDAGNVTLPDSPIAINAKTENHAKAFGNIQFSGSGEHTYTFIVKENVPEGANADNVWTLDNLTYDNSSKTVTVRVKDNDSGELTAEVVDESSDELTFTNVYYNPDEAKSADTKQGDVVVDETGETAGVGDTIHYEIAWANNAVDDNGVPVAAKVVVSDTIPEHTSLVENSASADPAADSIVVNDGVITWTFDNQLPGATGTVSFDVTVDESAGGTDVTNTATVIVNDHQVGTNEVTTSIPGKSMTDETPDNGLMVGDVLDFEITYKNTSDKAATVTVTDTLPIDLTYVGVTGQTPDPQVDGQKLVWSIEGVAPDTKGTITFQARVNEHATTVDIPAQNTAYVKVGDNTYKTNTTTGGDKPATGDLSITKHVTANQGATINANKDFGFTIDITDSAGNKLTGTYVVTGVDDVTEVTFNNGQGPISLKHGETATIKGLPEGSEYTVTEASAGEGYVQTAPADAEGNAVPATGSIPVGEDNASVTFENAYTPGGADFDPVTEDLSVTKVMAGNGEGDEMKLDGYTFELNVANNDVDHAAEGFTVNGSTQDTSDSEGVVDFDGTSITFTQVGTYTVTVKEVLPADDNNTMDGVQSNNVTYDTHSFTYTVNVTDTDFDGKLEANVDAGSVSEGEGTFTNVYYNPDEAKESTDSTPETGVQVGDQLTYTVDYVNTTDQTADVTIVDVVPTEITVDATSIDPNPASFDPETNTITWVIEDVPAYDGGVVTFTGTVNESAIQDGTIENQASLKIGENGSEFWTNKVTDKVATGGLSVAKTVQVDPSTGLEVDENKEFDFTLTMLDASGEPLTGTYTLTKYHGLDADEPTTITFDENGTYTFTLKDKESVGIEGLPEGATYIVTENLDNAEGGEDYGYTQTSPKDGKPNTGTIVKDTFVSAPFTNSYGAAPTDVDAVPAGFAITKVLEGKDWNGDSFTFQLSKVSFNGDTSEQALASMPMPADATKTVSEATDETEVGGQVYDSATFDFGAMQFSVAGTYVYQVTEVAPTADDPAYNAGITYDTNPVTVTITVTDRDQHGASTGKLHATAIVANDPIVNTYDTGEVNVDAQGGLQILKNLKGHDIVGDMFGFTLTATSDDAKAKFGEEGKVVLTSGALMAETGENAGIASETIPLQTGLEFDKSDVGKEFIFTVAETRGGDTALGYVNDTHEYKVQFVVSDDAQGTLKVETYVDDVLVDTDTAAAKSRAMTPVTLTFNNSYDAGQTGIGGDGQVVLNATKTLTNRDMIAGEFTFNVTDKNDAVVTTGTNAAATDGVAGAITFDPITYTTDRLNAAVANGSAEISRDEQTGNTIYTFVYDVTEATPVYEGVTPVQSTFSVKITVIDNGQGELTASITYPNGSNDNLAFTNVYGNGEGGTAKIAISGKKDYVVASPANNAPSIVGQYTFTLTGVDKATGNPLPAELMPDTKEIVLDGTYGVNFGTITYTMENVFGAEQDQTGEGDIATMAESPERTRTFVYTVAETGKVEGVDNDATPSKSIEVKVTDNGDGTITATKSTDGDATDFTFTNTYSVDPKDSSLTGDGGFTISKVLHSNTGREIADGVFTFQLLNTEGRPVVEGSNVGNKVTMPAVHFEVPGTYNYTLVEVDAGAPSMEYDDAVYNVTAKVTDNGKGQLEVAWSIEDVTNNQVTFTNTYTAKATSIIFNAAKMLDGRDLKEGEFTFELRENGEAIATATNTADGSIAFDPVEYTEPGEHDYEIVEIAGNDETITYDNTVYTVHVNVVDNTDTGKLDASDWSYGENGSPVFHNTYTEPPAPDEVIPATGDAAVAAVAATVTIGGTLVAAGYVTSKKRGE